MENREDKMRLALCEMLGALTVIARKYPDTVPGALAMISITEVAQITGRMELQELVAGGIEVQYSRISDLLKELEPLAAEIRLAKSMVM